MISARIIVLPAFSIIILTNKNASNHLFIKFALKVISQEHIANISKHFKVAYGRFDTP